MLIYEQLVRLKTYTDYTKKVYNNVDCQYPKVSLISFDEDKDFCNSTQKAYF